ncbi:peptidoglycan-binding domain-containing protein [Streptomyces sp. TE5632]
MAHRRCPAVALAAPGVPSGGRLRHRGIQEALTALCYDPGPIDSVNGPLTRAAVSVFQRGRGLPEDGRWGERTRMSRWWRLCRRRGSWRMKIKSSGMDGD